MPMIDKDLGNILGLTGSKTMEPFDDDEPSGRDACNFLADMILELQQMALRLGAPAVSHILQDAYVEARRLEQAARPTSRSGRS